MRSLFYHVVLAFCVIQIGTISVVAQVTAAFSGTPTSGCKPLNVSFTDQSTGSITSWLWDFGNGTTSTVQNPSAVYSSTGNYTVKLIVSDGTNTDSITQVQYITAQGATAGFSATPLSGPSPLTVFFTSTSSSSGGTINSWLWNFGDGNTSTLQNPTHVYTMSGTYIVTLKVNNTVGCGDSTGQALVITVTTDEAKFSASAQTGCPPLSVNFSDNSVMSAPIVSWLWDFGDGTTSTAQHPGHTYTNYGVYNVSLTVTDSTGSSQSTTETSFINTQDVTDPVLSCGIAYAEYSAFDCFTGTVSWVPNVSASDNCELDTVIINPQVGAFIFAGSKVTATATDAAGNTSNCAMDVIFYDFWPPVVNCLSSNINEYLDGSCQFVLPDYTLTNVSAFDNCSYSLTQTPPQGTVVSSSQLITITAFDGSNSSACSFNLTVSDSTSPVISCLPTQNVDLGASCNFTLPDYTSSLTISDNCGIASTVQTPPAGTIITATQTISILATDVNGNSKTCVFDVIPADTTSPTIVCLSDQNVSLGASCNFTLPDYISSLTISDDCGIATTMQTPAAGTIITTTQSVSILATDVNGNTKTCVFNVIPTDTTLPTMVCLPDQNVSLGTPCNYTIPDYTTQVAASDNCGIASVSQSPIAGTVITTTQLITINTIDVNGNTNVCTFNVIPSDTTSPTIACVVDQNVGFDGNCQFILPDYTTQVTANDNCGTVTITQLPIAGTAIIATQMITMNVVDGSGNNALCTFLVIPTDTSRPSISCIADQQVSLDSNCHFILPNYIAQVTTSDNCGPISVRQSPVAGTAITADQVIKLTVEDGNGNLDSCVFSVTPTDDTDPLITCPANINVDNDPGICGAVLTYDAPIVIENCSGPVTEQTTGIVSGNLFPIGTTTNTYLVTDASGNTASCAFDVVVQDTEAPTIACPGNIETCDSVLFIKDPEIADNCPSAVLTMTSGLESGDLIPIGTTTNSYEVEDAHGNKVGCEVTITRLIQPTVEAGDDQSINAGTNVRLEAKGNAASTYRWSPSSGLSNPNVRNPLASPEYSTTYTIVVTSSDGCQASDELTVQVNGKIEVNNFMSPNGDGKNDTWDIKGHYLMQDCLVQIYDSWGNLIKEERGYANDWDGTRNGKPLPEGNYYYVISCDSDQPLTGSITLIR